MSDEFDNTAEGLLPMLEPAKWLAEMEEFDIPVPIYQRFAAGLFLTYILDMGSYIVTMAPDVVQQFMGEFNPPLEKVHATALQNLRNRVTPADFQVEGEGAQITIRCQATDKFAAARILVRELLDEWDELVPGNLLIGIPYRDYLVVFGDQDPDFVAQMRAELQFESEEFGYPLTTKLLTWKDEYLMEYEG